MPRTIAFKCKTSGCPVWFPIRDMPEDTVRSVHFVLRLEVDAERLKCPECGQTHDYFGRDKEEVKTVS